jgi:preprotein translocase subunit SecF
VNKANISIEEARSTVEATGIQGEVIVQKIGNDKVRIQTGTLTNAQSSAIEEALVAKFSVNIEDIDTQIVGPSWGKEITKKALYGLFAFLLAVMLFLAMAFEPKMAIAAIVAVVHDVFITVGIYAVVGFDVTPATVIGFLTILGYSLYDTVVVFDKVRENTKSIAASGKSTYSDAANLAVNQTIVRSANTSIIALLPVGSILLAVGTYSSIFIAPPFLAALREKEPAMIALAKRVAARGGAAPVVSEVHAVRPSTGRGPRNQPKRKGRK